MSTVNLPATIRPPEPFNVEELLPKVELIETDGQNMDSDWHRLNIELLLASIRFHFRERNDYYAAGNSFIYYSQKQVRNRDFKGPDFFVVRGASREPIRDYWVVWEEDGLYPNVIIELLSPTTANEDLSTKKRIYEQTFRTPNYYCFDPVTRELLGWNLERTVYARLTPNELGWLWSDELQLWVGAWEGEFSGYRRVWLRFFTPDGQLALVPEEHQLERAETERVRAETEKQRAETAEAEVTRLKTLLAQQGIAH